MELKKPEIKSWDCTDHDPIEEWMPDDPSMVEFWCNISIGIEGEEGADNFQVHVVTSKMISQIKDKNFMVVIPIYEGWEQILEIVNSKLAECSDLNWPGISERLSELFYWEYENYQN